MYAIYLYYCVINQSGLLTRSWTDLNNQYGILGLNYRFMYLEMPLSPLRNQGEMVCLHINCHLNH